MGLKTTNLTIKETDEFLSEAYAIVNDIEIHGSCGVATFNIQKSREKTFFKKPIKQVRVQLSGINRDEPLLPQIYAQAKRKQLIQKWDKETGKASYVEVDSYFTKWDDDIYEPPEINSEELLASSR